MASSPAALRHGILARDVSCRRSGEAGFDLQLARYDERGWRGTFYTTGMQH